MSSRRFVCLVTDRRRLAPGAGASESLDRLVDLAGAAAHAGVDLIQLRERDLCGRDLVALAERCVDRASGTACSILLNDRVDVALASGAHGVHLRADSVDAPAVRALAAEGFVIGRSVHGATEAGAAARAGGLDYLILGTMFPSTSKSDTHTLAGLDELARATAAVAVPVLAIGGITLQRVEAVMDAGAGGIAAISLFIPPPGVTPQTHLEPMVRSLRRLFDTC